MDDRFQTMGSIEFPSGVQLKLGRALKQILAKSLNLGCALDHSINLAPKVPGTNVITGMHSSLKGANVIDELCLCLRFQGMPNLNLLPLGLAPLIN